MSQQTATLAELLIVACSEVWRDNGEILVTGIGTIPRIAAGLAKLTHSPEILMTDGEAYLVEDPVPLGASREQVPGFSGWMPYSRVFDIVWRGNRHAMVTPVQVDRWGQSNISVIGDYAKPKVQMLGARGFPGNSINHINSMFLPNHSPRVLMEGEVHMVGSAGYRDENWQPGAKRDFLAMGQIITNLGIMDFGGPDHQIRVIGLHPGVTFEQVQAATGFPLAQADELKQTPLPSAEQLAIIDKLDPKNFRSKVLKGNPPARSAQHEGAAV